MSGCLDKIVRVWDISKRKVTDYINVTDLITSISFFPDGNQIVVGFHNGKVNIFDLYVNYNNLSLNCYTVNQLFAKTNMENIQMEEK